MHHGDVTTISVLTSRPIKSFHSRCHVVHMDSFPDIDAQALDEPVPRACKVAQKKRPDSQKERPCDPFAADDIHLPNHQLASQIATHRRSQDSNCPGQSAGSYIIMSCFVLRVICFRG